MALVRARYAAEDLRYAPRTVYHLRCTGCLTDLLIPFGDARAEPHSDDRPTPGHQRCARCNGICVVVNGPPPTYLCECTHCTKIRAIS